MAGPRDDAADVVPNPNALSDRIANRALLFVALTGLGVVTYVVCLAVVGPLVPVRGADAVLVGGALAAVLLLARDRAQRGVDWLLYGDRRDPERAILRVGRRVESAADPAGLVDALAETVAAALRLSFVEVELADGPAECRVGTPTRHVTDVPLVHQGRTLGTLRAGRRGEALGRADVQVLAGVAPQLAAAAETGRLQRSLAAARERVVRAREEERRRLRRDLHDVLGPALAGVGLGLDAARSRARRDPDGADELIAQVQEEVRGCVGEIRKIIEGLRPPVLDERGLLGALQQQADLIGERSRDVRVRVHGDVPAGLPAAVEVGAYLIGQEAVANAVRHASAHAIDVTLTAGDADLVLEVGDDGTGLPAERRDGVGLSSMAERAGEIGGELLVAPGPAGGTVVTARLPLRSTTPDPGDGA
ncbi:MAG TPA: sensor histidine kinase [Blastococcus sp.]|nr:sensor histidine kinase [Blastococcus sp.]